MIRVTTMNSVYEMTDDGKKVRRVKGKHPATPNLGDGDWRDLEGYDSITLGQTPVYVFNFGAHRATITSRVMSVEVVPNEPA